ncbi:hypothetical protein LCGC14_1551040 [marine sediment metagenome]|uniref:DUF2190 domain-containing protein n=1 Tax=marine sediment metagenome TaxID=412755 RepID=A0A0F9IQ83_9ZZZZ
MTNEAVLKIETHIPVNFTCSTTVTIEKGAICKMIDPFTAVLADGDNDIVAGIVQSEKLAAETSQDSVSIFRGGVFRVTLSGSASAGDPVATAAGTTSNAVWTSPLNNENVLGIMLEDGTDGQTKLMELRPTTMQLA